MPEPAAAGEVQARKILPPGALTSSGPVLNCTVFMSARRLAHTNLFDPITIQCRSTRLDLPAELVTIRKNGIEFQAREALAPWAEMTITLETPLDGQRIQCNGVVVSCHGNRHSGYRVSLVFTNVSQRDQARLVALAYAQARHREVRANPLN